MLSHKTPTNLNSWGFLQEKNRHVNWVVWGPASKYTSEVNMKQASRRGDNAHTENTDFTLSANPHHFD